mmetsp:Transcript_13150/g.22254  ORF Transcript_13150/g.22254 Transcript_13150/m.22254 type:complete len:245 (-) Transcript_13150:194-928(-)|eukprot:CAMPEP_0198211586 /NCGR_PEP_ID=MMETSP1445-20131203/24605_1 /TAXON_ID=36898 /ORGANISM="Pyramimonas sp., Strain CCMP2087" /LENGTH=244 /DNA_ID=CAMNT_0043885865 /DNA_START=180 /DNA_END=914 /DNA_ORIENTATION=+
MNALGACNSRVVTRGSRALDGREHTAVRSVGAFGTKCASQRQDRLKFNSARTGRMRLSASMAQLPKNVTSPNVWQEMSTFLTANKTVALSPEQVVKSRGKIVDIRTEDDYAQVHAEGAINVQLYRPLTKTDVRSVLKRAQLAMLTPNIGATEENPNFLEDIAKVASKRDKIIVVCDSGGTLKGTPSLKYGKLSRSLIAAYFLKQNGYKNVSFMEGGLGAWVKDDLPCGGEGLNLVNRIYRSFGN